MNFQGKHDVGELSPPNMFRFMLVICQTQPNLLSLRIIVEINVASTALIPFETIRRRWF